MVFAWMNMEIFFIFKLGKFKEDFFGPVIQALDQQVKYPRFLRWINIQRTSLWHTTALDPFYISDFINGNIKIWL